MSISDNSQDRAISMVTRLWTARPGVRIQVEEWDYLGLLPKMPRPALGVPPSSYSLGIGGGGFRGVKRPELGADQLSPTTMLRISRDNPLTL